MLKALLRINAPNPQILIPVLTNPRVLTKASTVDEYIKEAVEDGIPQEAAEQDLAEIVYAHMNELAKNATELYEIA